MVGQTQKKGDLSCTCIQTVSFSDFCHNASECCENKSNGEKSVGIETFIFVHPLHDCSYELHPHAASKVMGSLETLLGRDETSPSFSVRSTFALRLIGPSCVGTFHKRAARVQEE